MHQRPAALPAVIETPDAVIRRRSDFGKLDGRRIDIVRGEMAPGADTTPLLGDDLCQVPHWGYLVDGEVTVRYTDGTEEVIRAGEVFHWPPGHTILTEDEPAEMVLFSPGDEHGSLLDHLQRAVDEMGGE